jgi:hypothetical protein
MGSTAAPAAVRRAPRRTLRRLTIRQHAIVRVPVPGTRASPAAPGAGALVRLRGRGEGAVEVRLCAAKSRAVSNRNCVAAMRGGEQRNENGQSVTQVAESAAAVNSIRSVWMGESASERRSLSWRDKPAGSRAIPGRCADGWRQNGRKSPCRNQGGPPGTSGVHGGSARRTARRESERP